MTVADSEVVCTIIPYDMREKRNAFKYGYVFNVNTWHVDILLYETPNRFLVSYAFYSCSNDSTERPHERLKKSMKANGRINECKRTKAAEKASDQFS